LGIIAGLVTVACNIFIPQIASATDTYKRITYGYVGLLASTVFSMVALVAWRLFLQPSFVWFGVSLCATYILGLAAYFLQNIKLLRRNSEK
jgi:hypothetical protein